MGKSMKSPVRFSEYEGLTKWINCKLIFCCFRPILHRISNQWAPGSLWCNAFR